MRCFYELLEVERTADLAELKKAYYKASLRWHPDKNPTEEATAKFQEIQEAYRVLSNAQERAWYDRHREEILRGGQGGAGGNYQEERLDVFQFFSRSCFVDYDDEPRGFYTVFRCAFEEIAKEEQRAFSDYSTDFPSFGKSDSDYESVVQPFYTFWECFSTRKSYSWVEPYDTRRLNSRTERRAAEVENRKAREAAKKERNEEVRQLVAYVRRRDKRLEAQWERLAEAAKSAHARNQQQANKVRQRNIADLEEAWAGEMATGGLAAQWAEEFEAELSKIESEMWGKRKETGVVDDTTDSSESDEDDELYCVACDKSFSNLGSKKNHEASKKHKKQMELLREALLEEEKLTNEGEEPWDEEDTSSESNRFPDPVDIKLTKRSKKARRRQQRVETLETNISEIPNNLDEALGNGDEVEKYDSSHSPEIKSKAPPPPRSDAQNNICLTCMEQFLSRNKLFIHIKETGHAALKPTPQVPPKKKKKSRNS